MARRLSSGGEGHRRGDLSPGGRAWGNSFPDAFPDSVVTTRNLLEAALASKCLRRFVNISSFTVYNNRQQHGDQSKK